MNYQQEYKTKYQRAVEENFDSVREELKNKDADLMQKIEKRSAEYGIPEADIIKDIKACDTAVISFVKSPAKQNFYEKTVATMI